MSTIWKWSPRHPLFGPVGRVRGFNGRPLIGQFIFATLAIIAPALCVPFLRQTHYSWAEMNLTLQALVLLLTAALFCHACLSLSLPNALRLFGYSVFVSYAAESMGIHWGLFGSPYSYDQALLPMLPGGVPCFILLVWFDQAYMALGFVHSFSIRPKGALSLGRLLVKSALCGFFIMGCGLVLDPLGTSSGMWVWSEPGGSFGTPLSNFAVWYLVGAVMCGCYLLTERPAPGNRRDNGSECPFIITAVCLFMPCLSICFAQVGSGAAWPAYIAYVFNVRPGDFRLLKKLSLPRNG